jgi:hypothetical protein
MAALAMLLSYFGGAAVLLTVATLCSQRSLRPTHARTDHEHVQNKDGKVVNLKEKPKETIRQKNKRKEKLGQAKFTVKDAREYGRGSVFLLRSVSHPDAAQVPRHLAQTVTDQTSRTVQVRSAGTAPNRTVASETDGGSEALHGVRDSIHSANVASHPL